MHLKKHPKEEVNRQGEDLWTECPVKQLQVKYKGLLERGVVFFFFYCSNHLGTGKYFINVMWMVLPKGLSLLQRWSDCQWGEWQIWVTSIIQYVVTLSYVHII